MTWLTLFIIASSVLSGLVGGVFFAFSVFVMRALAQLPAPQGLAAMQRINVTVITPLFLGAFLGALPVLAVSAYLAHAANRTQASVLLGLATLVYALGSVVVTLLFNVPRNDRLASCPADTPQAADYWRTYVREWSRWNHVRCVASLLATALAALSATF
jgi:uncharacterized membrane protein